MAVGRHLGYLITQILSEPLELSYCFASVCQISWESVDPLPNYSILSKSNMAVGRHLGFLECTLFIS
jgi:hypothetical protein